MHRSSSIIFVLTLVICLHAYLRWSISPYPTVTILQVIIIVLAYFPVYARQDPHSYFSSSTSPGVLQPYVSRWLTNPTRRYQSIAFWAPAGYLFSMYEYTCGLRSTSPKQRSRASSIILVPAMSLTPRLYPLRTRSSRVPPHIYCSVFISWIWSSQTCFASASQVWQS